LHGVPPLACAGRSQADSRVLRGFGIPLSDFYCICLAAFWQFVLGRDFSFPAFPVGYIIIFSVIYFVKYTICCLLSVKTRNCARFSAASCKRFAAVV
jgi:hypothetical protein